MKMSFISSSIFAFFFLCNISSAQNTITVHVNGLDEGDVLVVIAQQGSRNYQELELKGGPANSVVFDNKSVGEWAIKLDATVYIYPKSKVINVDEDEDVYFDIEKYNEDKYVYSWTDIIILDK